MRRQSRPAANGTASTVVDGDTDMLLDAAPCPPQHRARLRAAGVGLCSEDGGCPLCRVDTTAGGDYCCACELAAVAVVEHESPPADPYCMRHGLPTEETRRSCVLCDQSIAEARLRGWSAPTGHDGPDCCHCSTCGLCKGTGRVCRRCWRCPDHVDPLACYECERIFYSRAAREERSFYEHSFFDPTTGRWVA